MKSTKLIHQASRSARKKVKPAARPERDHAREMGSRVRQSLAEVERGMFNVDQDEESRARAAEIMRITRAQLADDSPTNDRQRFGAGGERTLSVDAFAEVGYEIASPDLPQFGVREEQEALEEGMAPFISALTQDQSDAVRMIHKYGFSYRDSARRLGITTPALQRRMKRSIAALRKNLAAHYGRCVEVCAAHKVGGEG